MAGRLGKDPIPALLKIADDWVVQARVHRDNFACNMAHDLRDAVAVSAENPGAAREYVLWRVEHARLSATVEELAPRVAAAKGLIKANWLCACGAIQFSDGDRTNCQSWFDRVIEEFPKSPRAEMAMFLNARCLFSASRAEKADANSRKAAITAFENFRKHYPRGRLDADALGWLGALAYDSENYLKALDLYIAQAETPGHPETLPTAIYSCEKSLARVASKPGGEAAFALIARHPRIAMAFTYLVLSAPEADNYNGKWDNPADVRKWRRTLLPRIATAVAKQKDAYKSSDWQPRYLAMLVQAASGSGDQAQALRLSQIAPDQLKRSDDLLFARGITLQRAGKTSEAIDAFQAFLKAFPKSPMQPGVRVRLALALQDNHQAGQAIAVLYQLLPKPEPETTPAPSPSPVKAKEGDESDDKKSDAEVADEKEPSPNELGTRFTEGEVYPISETDWKMTESSVYPNLSGADEDQIGQLIDTLFNFSPLPELAAALDNPVLTEANRAEMRAILAERYLAAENFVEAEKFITVPAVRTLVNRLQKLTSDTGGSAPEKAERMVQLGDTWAGARGQLLRTPLGTRIHVSSSSTLDGLTRRDNGAALHLPGAEDQLDDRDELHHASRWWMRAARLVPSTPTAARARLKALETLPQVARASHYAETRAREIKLEAVSREIYDKLRSESPKSPEAQRFAAYWSVPPATKAEADSSWAPPDVTSYYWPDTCTDEASSHGYPFSDDEAFQQLVPAREQGLEVPAEIITRVRALRGTAAAMEPVELLKEVTALSKDLRASATGAEDAGGINCMEDLAQFLSEPGVTREAQDIYVNLRLDLLHRARAAVLDPGMSGTDSDETVSAEIDAAQKNPLFKSLGDYLDICRMALVSGARSDVATDIKDPKDAEHPVTYISRDHAEMEKMAREFLQKYPHSQKKEAALFVLARSVYALSCPFINCIGIPLPGTQPVDDVVEVAQKPYTREPFQPERVMKALDDYDHAFPNGRYAMDVRNLRAATFWRMGRWDKALDLTLAQISDKTHPELFAEGTLRLANIFAELANVEHRPDVMAAIQARPATIPFLQAYTAAATKSREHPLRYLQKYVSDQCHFKIPVPDQEVAGN